MIHKSQLLLAVLYLCACAEGGVGSGAPTSPTPVVSDDPQMQDGNSPISDGQTVSELLGTGCSTAVVNGLSEQLILEIQCLTPEALVRVSKSEKLDYGPAVFPYLQSSAAAALERAQSQFRETYIINSMYRSLAQQFMLYRWYKEDKCGITLAAAPGQSPHERGLSLDISEYADARSALESHGWKWHGPGDLPHFDFERADVDMRTLSVRAFQKLWNRHHPRDLLVEDGNYGPQTEMRLLQSPADGFRGNVSCGSV